jgi:hypothetical protein
MIAGPIQAKDQIHPPKREEAARPLAPAIYRLLYLRDSEGHHILVRGDGSQLSVQAPPNQRRQPLCAQCSSVPTTLR